MIMGQAKLRGTFEQRKALAIKLKSEQNRIAEIKRLANRTPEERKKDRESKQFLCEFFRMNLQISAAMNDCFSNEFVYKKFH